MIVRSGDLLERKDGQEKSEKNTEYQFLEQKLTANEKITSLPLEMAIINPNIMVSNSLIRSRIMANDCGKFARRIDILLGG